MRKRKNTRSDSAAEDIAALILTFKEVMDSGGYPTPEEIMSTDVEFDDATLRTTEAWKVEVWYPARQASDEHRFEALKALIMRLANDLGNPLTAVRWEPDEPLKLGGSYADGTVTLYGKPSVITALHELGHHITGRGEADACAWSVHLFRLTFPRAFEKLSWNGHRLLEATDSGTPVAGGPKPAATAAVRARTT